MIRTVIMISVLIAASVGMGCTSSEPQIIDNQEVLLKNQVTIIDNQMLLDEKFQSILDILDSIITLIGIGHDETISKLDTLLKGLAEYVLLWGQYVTALGEAFE